ncbi:MAG: hypothetical protein LAT68_05820 [Cyclobacteriaceae bacterium]|nr:hypothetical protein [Cyclobacteriaceae bacterium]MCH8515830.1 hypothetical protein [Cyclobacteriaceae bacterium]
MKQSSFKTLSLLEKINTLYKEGVFVTAIRYYGYKVNLYALGDFYVEAFYNHALDKIEKIEVLDDSSTRMNFYADQIKLPSNLLS